MAAEAQHVGRFVGPTRPQMLRAAERRLDRVTPFAARACLWVGCLWGSSELEHLVFRGVTHVLRLATVAHA